MKENSIQPGTFTFFLLLWLFFSNSFSCFSKLVWANFRKITYRTCAYLPCNVFFSIYFSYPAFIARFRSQHRKKKMLLHKYLLIDEVPISTRLVLQKDMTPSFPTHLGHVVSRVKDKQVRRVGIFAFTRGHRSDYTLFGQLYVEADGGEDVFSSFVG